ncbi:serine/threonine protein kinase [Mucilaginibacter gracilis]|uniref:Serine/threonine protein kinase n=1 Tax=Mucilaginibacter gracilis TaxID=423350 RepID=A0A495IUX3_9SPHI|nr:lanthionine synthetase LanC family protein [Mucilaginibacter gracilis]RKR80556.1 serine/threonine protein kinase [Mucilaginibacter gracilis]
MKEQYVNTPVQTEIAPVASGDFNYATVLTKYGLEYQTIGNYLSVGSKSGMQGWVLHISIIRQEMALFMNQFLSNNVPLNFSFTIPANSTIHTRILDGSLGYGEIGKVISIYPPDKKTLTLLANQLIELTKTFAGPVIPGVIHLANNVYTSFNHEFSAERKVKWPFHPIKEKKITKPSRWIGKYLIVSQLKGDAKGNVYKCLNLNNWRNIHWCVVKQGLAHQCTDDFGRTIKDRLEWQYELLQWLTENRISLSKPVEYFEHKNDGYLVIEYIDGINLYDKVNQLHQGQMWIAMPIEARRELIKILLEVVSIVDNFHRLDTIHRDLNPGNFLVRMDGTVVGIDIELAHDEGPDSPKPPFTLGTPGYISPQQLQLNPAGIEDDYFGLGALMLKVFTGISPSKFTGNKEEDIFKSMKFFTDNNAIASMISRSLVNNPQSRPKIKSMRHTLSAYDALLLTNLKTKSPEPQIKIHGNENTEIKELIQKGLNALAHPIMMDQFGYWISKNAETGNAIANEFRGYESLNGFANGAGGILYILANAGKLGFDLKALNIPIQRNSERLEASAAQTESGDSGLFYGSSGNSVALCALINAGVLEKNIHYHNQIYQGLTKPSNGVNLATGSSGRGLAMIYCASHTQQQLYEQELHSIVSDLLKEQQSDGSWIIKKHQSDKKGIKLLGFSYGIAGIVYFLLMYYSKYNDEKVKKAIFTALSWLLKQLVSSNGHLLWPLNSKNGVIEPWFEYGFTGVALTFIKAYEIFKENTFKVAATEALASHPKFICSNYITVNNGLAGLGHVYIEAYKAFKDEDWRDRARYIVYYLMHCRKTETDGITYWQEGNFTQPSASYMYGNAGIINFLMHYTQSKKINWSLFNF